MAAWRRAVVACAVLAAVLAAACAPSLTLAAAIGSSSGPGVNAAASTSSSTTATQTAAVTTFNETLSFSMLQFAWASFCSESSLMSWTCFACEYNPGFKVLYTIYDPKTEAYGFVGWHAQDKYIAIGHRGSSNLPNWEADFEFFKRPYPGFEGARVHRGFFKCWQNLADQVVGGVTKIQAEHCPDCRTVYVTGHSLGAAIAGINAIELATNGSLAANTTVRLLNFGMPRVGNKDFSDAFRHYVPFSQRMVHHRDIVPHLPPRTLGYYHIPTEIWNLDNITISTAEATEQALAAGTPPGPPAGERYWVCDGSGEDPHCSDSIPAAGWRPEQHDVYMGTRCRC